MTLVMQKGKIKLARHGDKMLKCIPQIPNDAVRIGGDVLIESHITGHKHVFNGTVQLWREPNKEAVRYVTMKSDTAQLSHDEHPTITILHGAYIVLDEVEFDPFTRTLRLVLD